MCSLKVVLILVLSSAVGAVALRRAPTRTDTEPENAAVTSGWQSGQQEKYRARIREQEWDCAELAHASRLSNNMTIPKFETSLRTVLGPAESTLAARRKTVASPEAPIRVFECGCGTGGVFLSAMKLFPDQKFTFEGVDLTPEPLTVARRCMPASAEARLSVGNCSHLPDVKTGSADLIVSISAGFLHLMSLEDARAQLSELLRIVDKGGQVVITYITMPAGDAREAPQCMFPQKRQTKVSHKWWEDHVAELRPECKLHFFDSPEFRTTAFEVIDAPCRYAVWLEC